VGDGGQERGGCGCLAILENPVFWGGFGEAAISFENTRLDYLLLDLK
jgi:hypothetical protein